MKPEEIAALKPGFTGADLANLVNEATLLATRRNGESVTMDDFNNAVERIVAGLEKRNRLINPHERKVMLRPITRSGRIIRDTLRSFATPQRQLASQFRRVVGLPIDSRLLVNPGIDAMGQEEMGYRDNVSLGSADSVVLASPLMILAAPSSSTPRT